MREMRSKCFAVVLAVLLSVTLVAGPALASSHGNPETPGANAMIFDTVFLRPLGLVSTVFGGAVFIVSIPFTLASGSTGVAAEKLVSDPFAYTFTRPLGQY